MIMDPSLMESFNFKKSTPDIVTEKTEDKCEKHGIELVKVSSHASMFGDRKFCPECAKELRAADEQNLVSRLSKDHYEEEKQKAFLKSKKSWLTTKSITSDDSLLEANFDSYIASDEETTANKERALGIARAYFKGEIFNTIIFGNVGTGKTHLARAILEKINEHSKPSKKCLFVSLDEMIDRLRATYGSKEEQEETSNKLRDLCVSADFLVIDDLGAESGSVDNPKPAANDVYRLINGITSGRQGKSTIITTNLNSEQIKYVYDVRIRSRIFKGVTNERIIKFEKTKDKRNRIEF